MKESNLNLDFDKYKKVLQEIDELDLKKISTWKQLFDLTENPFKILKLNIDSGDFLNQEMPRLVEPEKALKELLLHLGLGKKGMKRIVFIVGTYGAGKTTVIFLLLKILNSLTQDYPFKGWAHTGEFLLDNTQLDYVNEDDKDIHLRNWEILKRKGPYDYLIVDEANTELIKKICHQFYNTNAKIFTVTPSDLEKILTDFDLSFDICFLPVYEDIQIQRMLRNQLVHASKSDIELFNLIPQELFKYILKLALNTPYLLIKIIREALDITIKLKKMEVDMEILNLTLKRIHIPSINARKKIKSLDFEIFNLLKHKKLAPYEILNSLNTSRTTLYRRINQLTNENFLKKEGKKYSLQKFTAIWLESLKFKELTMKVEKDGKI